MDEPAASGEPNFAIDTLQRLQAELPAPCALYAIVGADSFLELRRWREPNELLERAEWIVVSRPNFSLADLAPLALTPEQRSRVRLLESVNIPVSATEVRQRLRAGLDCSDLITPEVAAYIRTHHLYFA